MPERGRRNILISALSSCCEKPNLPYIWAVLKTHCEGLEEVRDAFAWLDPIYEKGEATSLLEPYSGVRIDVLGLSCYIWNWDIQRDIARNVKGRNPECLVVAGGPHLDYKDSEFFLKNSDIDIVVVQDGEIPFGRILSAKLREGGDFSHVPGLYLPEDERRKSFFTGPAELPATFKTSPYLRQRSYFERLVRSNRPGRFNASWETNRGCPYGCSYCDWGSNTLTRIRAIDMDRIKEEIEWFAATKIDFIGINDANFGILPRDVDIIDMVTAARNRHGYPRTLFYCITKNNPQRNIEIARKISEAGIWSLYQLPFQHMEAAVLATINRGNLSPEKQQGVTAALKDLGVPVLVELMLGLPGDTYERWKACLGEVMESGLHDNFAVFPFILLPNAPAAEQDYIDEYEIETVDLFDVVYNVGRIPKNGSVDRLSKARFVVKTKNFSREDWVRMKVFSAFVRALHNCGLTQCIALYLRFTHNVPYRIFYEQVIEHIAASDGLGNELYARILAANRALLNDPYAHEYLELEQFPSFEHRLEGYRWLFVRICLEVERFFEDLSLLLLELYPAAAHLDSVIGYQKELVILPDYNREKGKVFSTDCDWVAYFEKARGMAGYEPLPEPDQVPGAKVAAADRVCGGSLVEHQLDWSPGGGEDAWRVWIERTVVGYSSASRSNFQRLGIRKRECIPKGTVG